MTLLLTRTLPVFTALFFFISGCAALIYQTAWQRLLTIFAGSDSQAIGIIITAFMLGLGMGHLIGGRLADHLTPRQNILTVVGLEVALALFGCVSPWLYHDLLCIQLGALTEYRFTSSVLLFLLLLPPTLIMGMTLPLLLRWLSHDLKQTPALTGLLYGINTLGAAMGALLTPWLLYPIWGITGSLRNAALLNLICALGLAALSLCSRRTTSQEPGTVSPSPAASEPSIISLPYLFAASGFLALGLEMVWFRILGVLIKSSAFTFGTLLGLFLLGLGCGSIVGIWLASRITRPLRAFMISQSLLAAYAAISITLLTHYLQTAAGTTELIHYIAGYEPLDLDLIFPLQPDSDSPAWFMLGTQLYLIIPLLLMGPPTFLMGLSFPLFHKAVPYKMANLGSTFGHCQAANIAGSTLGALIVSFLFFPMLGSAGTLRLLLGFGLLFMLLNTGIKKWTRLAAVIPIFILLFTFPGQQQMWAAMHGTSTENITVSEDSSGIAALKKTIPTPLEPWVKTVHVNGIGQSWIPYSGVHSILGALPILLHPRPEDIAIIGLGSGDTPYAAAARYETQSITCIEIIPGLLNILRQEAARHADSPIAAMLAETHIHHLTSDGRRFLNSTPKRFDIIETDALRPNSSGGGNLYSEEYFNLIYRRLKPRGYAVTWLPTERVRRTFYHVFPHVLDFKTFAIGSPDPITCTAADLRRRIGHLEVRQHFRLVGINIHRLLSPYSKLNFERLTSLTSPQTDINTDLFPKDEFELFLHSRWCPSGDSSPYQWRPLATDQENQNTKKNHGVSLSSFSNGAAVEAN